MPYQAPLSPNVSATMTKECQNVYVRWSVEPDFDNSLSYVLEVQGRDYNFDSGNYDFEWQKYNYCDGNGVSRQ